MNEELEHTETDVEGQVVEGAGVETGDIATPQVMSDKELNFAALRERTEGAERRAQEAEQRNRQYEQMMMDQQQVKQSPKNDDDESFDFSDAVDSDAFDKMTKKMHRQEQKMQQRLDEIEGASKQKLLEARDPSYLDVINKYLPDVIKSNPTAKDIIKNAPQSQQYDMMYSFATSNKDYVIEQHVNKAKADSRIVDEPQRVNSLGAMQGGSSAVGKESALNMSDESFYGAGGYLSKILENKIR